MKKCYILLLVFIVFIMRFTMIYASEFSLVSNQLNGIIEEDDYLKICTSDIDGDGLVDLLIGGCGGVYVALYEQADPTSSTFNLIDRYWQWEYDSHPTICDLDNDGRLDLFIGYTEPYDGSYISWYRQDAVNSLNFTLIQDQFAGIHTYFGAAPYFYDIDSDGFMDLLVGDNTGVISHYEQFNQYQPHVFAPVSSNFCNIDVGSDSDPVVNDYNNDGILDLFVASQSNGIYHYTQDTPGTYSFSLSSVPFSSITGYYSASIAFTDLDKDNYPDLLVGEFYDGVAQWEIQPNIITSGPSFISYDGLIASVTATENAALNFYQVGSCISINQNPTIDDYISIDGTTHGTYQSILTGLQPEQTYYIRGYAKDQFGTTYGNQIDATTLALSPPVVVTQDVTNITTTNAEGGGNVTSSGGYAVTSRGVCWSVTENPTINDNITSNGSGTGNYTSNITGLTMDTTYYLRAYAVNQLGTGYGEQIMFSTDGPPIVTTGSITNIQGTSATVGGNVTSGGGVLVTSRGICWNTTGNPSISDFYTIESGEEGDFYSELTDLTVGEEYFVKAYATNSFGTSYGNEKSFNTKLYNLIWHQFNNIDTGTASIPCVTELNGDGKLDLLVGNDDGKIYYYEQNSVNDTIFNYITNNFNGINAQTYASPDVVDLDGDNLLDMLVGSNEGVILHYEQDAINSLSFSLVSDHFSSISMVYDTSLQIIDIDGNHRYDLLVCDYYGSIFHYEQDQIHSYNFSLITDNFNNIDTDGTARLAFTDVDGNGLIDMMVGHRWGKLHRYEQNAVNSLDFTLLDDFFQNINVDYNAAPQFCDLNGNGYLDLILGNRRAALPRGYLDYYESANPTITDQCIETYQGISVTSNSVSIGANIYNDFHHKILKRGILYSDSQTFPDYTLDQNYFGSGDGEYYDLLENLNPGTTYWYKPYAISNLGVFFGEEKTVLTSAPSIHSYPGYSLEFNGINEYLSVGNDPNQPLGNSLTIEAWIKPYDLSTRQGIFSTRSVNDEGSFQLEVGPGGTGTNRLIVCGVNTWVAQTENNTLLENEWNHIAYTRSGIGAGTHKLYVNGVEQNLISDADYTFIDNSSEFRIASGTSGGQLFEGIIEEIKIWNVERTSAEIREHMHIAIDDTEPDLVSYIQCNQGFGNAAPSSLKGHGGILQNMDDSNWILSSIPFYLGETNTQTETAGTVTFVGTNVEMDFHLHNNAEITASYIQNYPNVMPNNSDDVYFSRYWVLNRSDDSSFNADLTFTVTAGLPSGLETNPQMVKLYTRPTYSDGDWTLLAEANSVDANQNKATFVNISDFSQFYIGIESPKVRLVNPSEFQYIDDGIDYSNFGSSSQYVFEDINNNGLLDMLVGTSTGKIKHYEQSSVYPSNFNLITSEFNSINVYDNADPTLTDLDNDGLLDLIVGNSFGALLHYEQASTNSYTFTQLFDAVSTISVGSYASPTCADLDDDGLLDLLIGAGNGKIFWYEQIAINSSTFNLVSSSFNSINTTSNARPEITDFEGDGIYDFVVGKPDGTLSYYIQDSENSNNFTLITENFADVSGLMGIAPSFCDLDQDLLLDMIVVQTNGTNYHYEQQEVQEIDFGDVFVGDTVTENYFIKAENLMSDFHITSSDDFYISLSSETIDDNELFLSPIDGVINQRVFVTFIPGENEESYGEIFHDSDLNIYDSIGLFGIKKQPEQTSYSCLSFEENDDYITFGNDSSFDIADNITLEMWVKVDSSGSNMNLLNKGDIRLLYWDADYESYPGKGFQLNLPGVETGWWEFGYDIDYNDWNHVAWTYENGELIAYINGIKVRSATFTNDITLNTDDFTFSFSWSESFFGSIDEIRLWNEVRTENELRENMYLPLKGFEDGLVSYWQFEEGWSDNVADIISENDGSLMNMANTAWDGSQIPFGLGFSSSEIITAAGNYNFVDTDVQIDIETSVDPVPVTVCEINDYPINSPIDADEVFDEHYWVIHKYSDDVLIADLTFTISDVLIQEDADNPSRIRLFRRDCNAFGNWEVITIASSVDENNGTILFEDIDIDGQFILGRKIPPDHYAGNCLEFDGIDDYVETSLNDLSGTEITIEYWFKGSSYHSAVRQQSGNDYIVAGWNSMHILSNDGGTIDGISVGFEAIDGSWHHIAMTWEQNTINGFTSYLDGKIIEQRNSNDTALPQINANVIFGSFNGTEEFMTGTLEEIRIWNICRSAEEIRENMYLPLTGLETGLISYWQFNNDSGTNVIDRISGNNGVLHNMDDLVWIQSTIPFGLGYSNSQILSNTGFYNFSDTDFRMTTYNNVTDEPITVTKIETTPNLLPQNVDQIFNDQYWAINSYGDESYNCDLIFSNIEGISQSDVDNPTSIKLFTRESNSDSAWIFADSAINVAISGNINEVIFENIGHFSQFIITRWIQEIDSPQNVTILDDGINIQLTWDEVDRANSYKIFASDTPDGTFSEVTEEGTFGRSGGVISTEVEKSQKSFNTVNVLQKGTNRATQTWTAPLSSTKKFYYIVASTEASRNPSKHSKNIKEKSL